MDTRYFYMALREWIEEPVAMSFKNGDQERTRRAALKMTDLTTNEFSRILFRAQYFKDEDKSKRP